MEKIKKTIENFLQSQTDEFLEKIETKVGEIEKLIIYPLEIVSSLFDTFRYQSTVKIKFDSYIISCAKDILRKRPISRLFYEHKKVLERLAGD